MADISTYEEGVQCAELGADIISTTLSGYTEESTNEKDTPDFELLEKLVTDGGSDLHVSSNLPPVARIDGKLRSYDYPPLSPDDVEALLFPMLSNEQRRTLEQVWELDFSYGIEGVGRFRVNFYKDKKVDVQPKQDKDKKHAKRRAFLMHNAKCRMHN